LIKKQDVPSRSHEKGKSRADCGKIISSELSFHPDKNQGVSEANVDGEVSLRDLLHNILRSHVGCYAH
jgi:hypothetical protein